MPGGKIGADVLALLLNNVRTPEEGEGGLGAQIAACQTGARRLDEICRRYGLSRTQRAASELLDYSEEMMRSFLAGVPLGTYSAEDFLDNDGVVDKPVAIRVTIKVRRYFSVETRRAESPSESSKKPRVTIDFTVSDPQAHGAINAVKSLTDHACMYVF